MVIGEVKKNTAEVIRVQKVLYKGKEFCDVRVYYENDQGTFAATKKGIMLSKDTIGPVLDLIKKASKVLLGIEGAK